MTQEEKAKAYDEALKKARFYHGNCPSEPERKKLERMFPVLRESEDESMLQTIIRGFENWKSNGNVSFNFTYVDDILAYLEKQKKQKEAL